ncbi:adipogenesis regulatory factor [Chelydra serpentina]|uniref:Adipogenesis regulatory factor n=1 Tax=Chelydra serpentina TaxID=8475 RepID=A0A8T1T222_CHESE|nr:adipogenesis regulatory factor [Chelydra serpentina]
MSGKGFQGFKQHAEGEVQDAANALGKSAQQVVNQATDAGQKAIDHACKTAQEGVEKTTGQASEAASGLGKKIGLKK